MGESKKHFKVFVSWSDRVSGNIMIFRFEMDTLEIILKEQLDVVDRFFLAEADLSHKGVTFFKYFEYLTCLCVRLRELKREKRS